MDDEVAGNGVIGVQRPGLAGRDRVHAIGTANQQVVLLRDEIGAAVAFNDNVEESAGRRVESAGGEAVGAINRKSRHGVAASAEAE